MGSQFKGKNVWTVHAVDDGMSIQKNQEQRVYVDDCRLDGLFAKIESGDKIRFHSGCYFLPKDGFDSKNIQIEGIGDCQLRDYEYPTEWENVFVDGVKVSIKNIIFDFYGFRVCGGGTAYLTNCKFATYEVGVVEVNPNGTLDCFGCRFDGDGEHMPAVTATGPC